MGVFDTAKHQISNLLGITAKGQATMPNSLPIVIASDQTVIPVNGGVAHDAVDTGNPVKLGGKASTTIPTAVATGDRVNAYFDDRGRLITKDDTLNSAIGAIGDAAVINGGTGSALAQLRGLTTLLFGRLPTSTGRHTGTDSLAVGLITDDTQVTGNNATAAITSDVGGTIIGFLRGLVKMQSERLPASIGPKTKALSFPIAFATDENNAVSYTITPATPVPAGSDITNVSGGAVVAGDLTIRDTAQHWLLIPMAVAGYRTCTFHLKNETATAWVSGQQPTIGLYAFFGSGTGNQGGKLLSFVSNINAGNRYSISANDVSLIGGQGGSDSPTLFSHFGAAPISDGFPYLALLIQSSVAPTQGEITQVVVSRMKY